MDNVKGTPRYWKKAKLEMLGNFGPFHMFYTLSCGEGGEDSVEVEFDRDGIKDKNRLNIFIAEEVENLSMNSSEPMFSL